MKLAFLILVAAINPVPAGDLVQTNNLNPSGFLPLTPAAATNHPTGIVSSLSNSNLSVSIWSGTNPPGLAFNAGQPSAKGKLPMVSTRACLKPGLYKTSPYTILVLVPGPHPDDVIVAGAEPGEMKKMPVFEPGLKFIPQSLPQGGAGSPPGKN